MYTFMRILFTSTDIHIMMDTTSMNMLSKVPGNLIRMFMPMIFWNMPMTTRRTFIIAIPMQRNRLDRRYFSEEHL